MITLATKIKHLEHNFEALKATEISLSKELTEEFLMDTVNDLNNYI